MPLATFRLFFDNAPADQERLDRFGEIRVSQAIGMAAEAELELPIGTDLDGAWSGFGEDFAEPFTRVRIEIQLGSDAFVALIDGPVVGTRFHLSAEPEASRMTLVVQDDSVLLNRDEKVAFFEDMASHEIAEALYGEHGLQAEVDSTPAAGAAFTRVVVQRGTNMQLIKELARRHGMFAYVRPGDAPGASVGVFQRPRLAPGDLPELLLLGPDRNVDQFEMEFDALRPTTAAAAGVRIIDKEFVSAEADSADDAPLGEEAALDVLTAPAATLLARTREEEADLDAATAAAVNLSSWAYSARGAVDADRYGGVLAPHQVVRVAGVGPVLSGDYLVSQVTHVISDAAYRQQFSLRRNARSAGGGGLGIPGGLF
jgi:phage protein D